MIDNKNIEEGIENLRMFSEVYGRIADTVKERTEKPPIGTAPSWIVAGKRMEALSAAIERYAGAGVVIRGTDTIRKWAKEIILQCDLVDSMEGGKNE